LHFPGHTFEKPPKSTVFPSKIQKNPKSPPLLTCNHAQSTRLINPEISIYFLFKTDINSLRYVHLKFSRDIWGSYSDLFVTNSNIHCHILSVYTLSIHAFSSGNPYYLVPPLPLLSTTTTISTETRYLLSCEYHRLLSIVNDNMHITSLDLTCHSSAHIHIHTTHSLHRIAYTYTFLLALVPVVCLSVSDVD
jgi:hypothetical protein